MHPGPADVPLAPGQPLPGTAYRLLRRLGSGAMGEVYEARHEPLDCLRALKILWPQHAAGSSSAKRLRVEARLLASLHHPNLVDVVDFGESQGRAFLAMTLLDGCTVGAALRRQPRLPAPSAVAIACGLLDGLHAAHSIGLVHRDVKPENAFLCTDGIVKLLDFGIAKVRDGQITDQGQTVGTPRYMAPEQILGHAVDARTDVYAMGVMLFEMLAGRAPFVADDPMALAYAHVKQRAPSLSSLAPDAPFELVRAVDRALLKPPDERFESARAFADALHGALPSDVAGAAHAAIAAVSRPAHATSTGGDVVSREWSVPALTVPLESGDTVDPLPASYTRDPRAIATRTATAPTHRVDGARHAAGATEAPVVPRRDEAAGVASGGTVRPADGRRPSSRAEARVPGERAPAARTVRDDSAITEPGRPPRAGFDGRLYVAEFHVPASHAQLTLIADDLAALKERLGAPVHYLGIVKASAEVPDATHREALGAFGKRMNEICDTAHLVLEGDGFRNALQRSVVTAVHILKRQEVTCHATTTEAAAHLCSILGERNTEAVLGSIARALRGPR